MHIKDNEIPCWSIAFGGDSDGNKPYTLSLDKMLWDPNYDKGSYPSTMWTSLVHFFRDNNNAVSDHKINLLGGPCPAVGTNQEHGGGATTTATSSDNPKKCNSGTHSISTFSPSNKASSYSITGSRRDAPGGGGGGGGGGVGAYHNQLHASLQAFKARKWRPLSSDSVPRPTVTRCRPISATTRPSSAVQPMVPRPPMEQRPDSSPSYSGTQCLSVYPQRPDTPRVTQGNFDTLSPRILCHLVTDPRPSTPNATYGDVLLLKSKRKSKKSKSRKKTEEDIFNDASSAVGEEDDEDDDGDDDDDDDTSCDSDDSDDVKESGATLAYRRKIPDSLQTLRPEQLDHVYTPTNKRDMTRFNFDAEKTPIPLYEFESPVPHPFNKINFRLHARESTNWRFASAEPEDRELSAIFDRLVELEKRQIATEEWEEKRMKGYWRKRHPPSRDSSSATNRNRDKRCCSSCLQPCCVGDCPNKKQSSHLICCETCHQPFCVSSSCLETKYEQRMRQPRETNVTSLPPRQVLPKNCRTCQRKHTAKLINANQVVLGRPKSAFSTFSRGKNSVKPKDLRPKSALNIERTISEKIEQLGIDPVQSTPSPKTSRPSSRNGIIPGKTYFSNLSRSLTDLTSKRRCKSAKLRRPRSRNGFKVKHSVDVS